MTGLFGKLFGKKKEGNDGQDTGNGEGPGAGGEAGAMVDDLLGNLLDLAGLDLSYDIRTLEDGTVHVDLSGDDEEMLTSKEGQLLDSLQLYLRRAVQHQNPEETVNVNIDCAGFREEADKALIALAEKLKGIALEKGKSVYFRALPPKDRKVIHQYLAEDGRVKSRSVGEGHFKKIKIYPIKAGEGAGLNDEMTEQDEAFGNR